MTATASGPGVYVPGDGGLPTKQLLSSSLCSGIALTRRQQSKLLVKQERLGLGGLSLPAPGDLAH